VTVVGDGRSGKSAYIICLTPRVPGLGFLGAAAGRSIPRYILDFGHLSRRSFDGICPLSIKVIPQGQ
jgi:hypothetical protein